ncbi:zinc finger CCCH domain-containing protein 7B [Spea bombifrons]|uniref:zinc finger CCCH domain-containing protein 7B n=1 Tax=Spea bombifrons TaxID=233779 RepID=UPI002349C8BD|nr:zinc finger CCCH domain-containing protein 7B [Spea bombifrons]XP_053325131.1 zinc finger CCCH domain-containing protein 7B [Spea bombifrons]XP_053325132.1 zinc finger CCCH domain-containing protein 7B [Spea bombifrons]
MARQKRKEDIEKGLQFIQSTIPFHGSQDDYEAFLQQLVRNLFAEGNELYREGNIKLALAQYTEGLTVAEYTASEELNIPQELQCKLYVNRSCCYYSMGLFEKSLEDSETALSLDKESKRALYRKAKALSEIGRQQEAYSCISHSLLALVQDERVTQLAQDLVQKLGLKQRKAYKRPQQELETFGLISNGLPVGGQSSPNNLESVDDIYTDLSLDLKQSPSFLGNDCNSKGFDFAASSPAADFPASTLNDCEVIGDDVDSLLDSELFQQQTSALSSQIPQLIPVFPAGTPLLPSLGVTVQPAPSPLPPASFDLLDSRKLTALPLKSAYQTNLLMIAEPRLDTLDSFERSRETLDCLDTFQNDPKVLESSLSKGCKNNKHGVTTFNNLSHMVDPVVHTGSVSPTVPNNPLAQTYDFKQACQQCYVKTGPKALDYMHKEKYEHKCKKDLLLARMKSSENKTWLRIRPRPMKVNFLGPYILCKDIQSRQDCKYGDSCTFAYYQEEIDVWNEEKKGTLQRSQLFQGLGGAKLGSVARLLQEQKGAFIFLCLACFDSKPQIISKRSIEKPDFCTNPDTQHRFSDHKCLVHVLNLSTVRYSKIRQLQPRFQMEMCRHDQQSGCTQEDACNFAHSHIELCVWKLQRQYGMSHDAIVQESEQIYKVSEPKAKPLDMKMKFVCGQCLRNGREVEADRDGKYCTAKARHSWSKDKRVLLVMSKSKKKWMPVRPLPSVRLFPQQYDICVHVQNGRKCHYIGNCTFAHSTEEKDMWTFMKENKVLDLQLLFELSAKNNGSADKAVAGAPIPQKEAEKQILMPTDYADDMTSFHCYLCGKTSNSEKQWQKHIQSDKHKEKLATVEKDEST